MNFNFHIHKYKQYVINVINKYKYIVLYRVCALLFSSSLLFLFEPVNYAIILGSKISSKY